MAIYGDWRFWNGIDPPYNNPWSEVRRPIWILDMGPRVRVTERFIGADREHPIQPVEDYDEVPAMRPEDV